MKRYLLPMGIAVLAGVGMLAARSAPAAAKPLPFRVPAETTIPAGAAGERIRLGRSIILETPRLAKGHVGNGLSCTSCHLGAGTQKNAGPFVGVAALYPVYRPRSGKVDTLDDRVNDCFERSLNGKPLAKDSPQLGAITAYMGWLSQGVPKGQEVEGRGFPRIAAQSPVDHAKGKAIFDRSCAACHGQNGQGQGPFPPLWGPQSFNVGAGMARHSVAAAFIKANMPLGQGNSLSNQDAHDVAAYMLKQQRPDFAFKARDWPKGGKPKDSPY